MKKTAICFSLALSLISARAQEKSWYATKMIEFQPAPGQFVNTQTANPGVNYALGDKGTLASLGGFGGYVVLGFDRPIVNDPKNPYGVDFSVKGNSFGASLYGVWTEPAAVQVMQDKNGDGIPNDGEWYELAGSDYYLSSTLKNVTITYYNPKYNNRATIPWRITTADGKEIAGAMLSNQFHAQSYYPDAFGFGNDYDSISFSGVNLLKGCIDLSTPSYIENYRVQLFGYADNKVTNSLTTPFNPYLKSISNSGDGFDLSWAVNSKGESVKLDTVHFVKIYTALNQDGGWLGELSSEVAAVGITQPSEVDWSDSVYYVNYIGVNQLKTTLKNKIQYEGFLFKNGKPSNEGTPKWWVSKPELADITDGGLLTPKATGELYVYFQQKPDVEADSVWLRIVELTGVVLEIEGNSSASKTEVECFVGERIFITAQSEDNIADVLNNSKANRFTYDTYDWQSAKPEVGEISAGLFHALSVGETRVTATSKTAPGLKNSMLVRVKPLPKIAPVSSPVKLPYYAPSQSFTNDKLFNVENSGATVLMRSVKSKNSLATTALDKNVFTIDFTGKSFGTDTVEFEVSVFEQDTVLKIPFEFSAPDVAETGRKLIFVNGGIFGSATNKTTLNAYDLATKTTETLATFNSNSVQDLAVDGAYAYVLAENYLSRVNISTGKIVAQKYLQDKTARDDASGDSQNGLGAGIAVYKNWILLTRQNSVAAPQDGYNIRVYNKTDLSLVKKLTVSEQATDIAVVGDKAYAVINGGYAGTTSSMAVIDLLSPTLELTEIPMGENALNVSTIIPRNDTLFCIRRASFDGEPAAVIIFKTAYNTFTVKDDEEEILMNISSTTAAGIAPIIGNEILINSDMGFLKFDISTGKFDEDEEYVMQPEVKSMMSFGSIFDTADKRYYITYGDYSGNGAGVIYNENFEKVGEIPGVGAAPDYVALSQKLKQNSAPALKATSATKTSSLTEGATTASNINFAKTLFEDNEKNLLGVYVKNWAQYEDFITPNFKYAAGAQIKAKFPDALVGKLDRDSVVNIYLEAIDSLGASTEFLAQQITLKPRIYGIFPNSMSEQTLKMNSEPISLPLADFFTFKTSTSVAYTYTLEENSNAELLTAQIDGDDLKITLSPDAAGFSDVSLKLTGKHSTAAYGEKSAIATVRFIVKEDNTALEAIDGDAINFFPNPFSDFIVLQGVQGEQFSVISSQGNVVLQGVATSNNFKIPTKSLPAGAYIIECHGGAKTLIKH